jgi:hypothetical protein
MAIHVLEEAAAGKYVDRLETATDPEDRQPTLLCDGPRFGLERITRRFDGGRSALGPAVLRGWMSAPPLSSRPSIVANASASRSGAVAASTMIGLAPWRLIDASYRDRLRAARSGSPGPPNAATVTTMRGGEEAVGGTDTR